MRLTLLTFFLTLGLFGSVLAYTQLIANSRFLAHSSQALEHWAATQPLPSDEERIVRVGTALERAVRYDDLIQATHLVDGMVVNRTVTGAMLDQCDSLLFSSLRFAALEKLGLRFRATEAWHAIERSQHDGHWLRHPRCTRSTSRDMITGLLVAFSQQPPGYADHLKRLLAVIKQTGGYFGTGPIYVSYLTPGIAKLLAMLAPSSNLSDDDLPEIVREGYSTNELTLYMIDQGYQAHLVALTVWLEMELKSRAQPEPRSLYHDTLDSLIRPFSSAQLQAQRLDWTTHQLVQLDPKNLFFRYLRLRAADALTPAVAYQLLGELLSMKQFPPDRLPMNCDRAADYLWQRAAAKYVPSSYACRREYAGTDFLWMASLLVEAARPTTMAVSH